MVDLKECAIVQFLRYWQHISHPGWLKRPAPLHVVDVWIRKPFGITVMHHLPQWCAQIENISFSDMFWCGEFECVRQRKGKMFPDRIYTFFHIFYSYIWNENGDKQTRYLKRTCAKVYSAWSWCMGILGCVCVYTWWWQNQTSSRSNSSSSKKIRNDDCIVSDGCCMWMEC